MTPLVALAVVTAVHVGFQLTVTSLVYPALAAPDADGFAAAHDHHSRRIVPLVGVVYLALVLVGGWVLVAGPVGPWVVLALVAEAVVLLTTAALAAPLHGALGRRRPDPSVLRDLRRVDRFRALVSVVGCAAALLAV